ncbi:MAG TPA: SpoIIE family protein phosphatase [Bryobacteraceae bacterium]|nr:SpoIIE family protein phosphatase [Bryobacteraceae bacterium]
MRELQIFSPDGRNQVIDLTGEKMSLGRSGTADLCFADDVGLSRQHLAIERDGDGWAIRDLGSKNGTMLNGARLTARTVLNPGDRIMAGHLILVYDGRSQPKTHAPSKPLVVFDENAAEQPGSATVITSLEGVIRNENATGAEQVAAAQVSALIRAGNELSKHGPLPELFTLILALAIDAVKADRGVLMTLEEGELVPRANKGEGFRISTAVRDRVLNSGISLLVRDTSIDAAFRERRSIVEQHIRTLMAVPLQTRDQIIGVIYVDSPSLLREFTKDDLNLLTVMANVAAIRIEHTRLAQIEQAKQLMARDLEQAAEIQRRFLPASAPRVAQLDLAGHNAPCRTVGGDYFDFFPYGTGRVAMVLGDVSGKGMPASLLMMGLQARVQVLIEEPRSLAEVMTKLNRITSANCPANRFISLFFCLVDGPSGEISYCNAGHNPPLLIRAAGLPENHEELTGGGPILGILGSADYQEHWAKLEPGDLLVIYSDGVTEAANADGEEFGVERLVHTAWANRDRSAPEIVDAVNGALAEYTGAAPQSDDITMIVARRTAQ